MARKPDFNKIYSATYSNVPVYEYTVGVHHIMRRRSDDWINATHILKVADYDKPARTRILEREVQKGVHEKVQGGYGKYQGTWIPLPDGKELATKNGVYVTLQPIFEYVPGDRSPPPAPKHATAASSKPRTQRAPAPPRRQPAQQRQQDYDAMDTSIRDDGTPDNGSIISDQYNNDYEMQLTGSRKRRRIEHTMTQADREHHLWADDLLDYFMLQEDPRDAQSAPVPPANADLDRPIDDKGHTALHWAAAMGDFDLVKDLLRRGARFDVQAKNGETPLMRAVIFTNCFDRQNMDQVAGLLIRTVNMQEWSGSTVFHHIATSTHRKSKYMCARYYMDSLLNKMLEIVPHEEMERILNKPDQAGDTAVTIAARHGARKCVRSLIGRGCAVDIPNHAGETADQLIVQLNHRRQERATNRQMSSSPFQPDGHHHHHLGGAVQPPNGTHVDPFLNGNSNLSNGVAHEVYKSDAAIAMTSQIMPLLFHKAKFLANNIDKEIAAKDAEVADAEAILASRQADMAVLKKRKAEALAREAEQTGHGAQTDEQMADEVARLQSEATELEQEIQDTEHSRLLSQALENAAASPPDEMDLENDALIHSKLALVRELIPLKKAQKNLINEIVENMSLAGLGEPGNAFEDKQAMYKRLITGALAIKEEDVEAMLPEIASELEDWRGLESVGA